MSEPQNTRSDPPVSQGSAQASPKALAATLLLFVLPPALILPTSFRRGAWEFVVLSLITMIIVDFAQRLKPMLHAYRLSSLSELWLKRVDRAFALPPVLYSGWLTDLTEHLHIPSIIKLIPTVLCSLCAPAHLYTRLTKVINGHAPLLRPIPFLTINGVMAAIVFWFIEVQDLKEFYKTD